MDKCYHIGFSKRGKTLVIEARENVDYLSPEIYDYKGRFITTKKLLRRDRYAILAKLQAEKPDVYGKLRFAVVE